MKKKIIYGFILVLLFSFTGCGESEDSASGNEVNAVVSVDIKEDNTENSNDVSENDAEEEQEEIENIIPIESISNCLYIANMSGKDIESLTITFSAGDLQGREILGEENLSDGELFTYVIDDMNSLKNAENLSLSINAVAEDETQMTFSEVSIIDPSQMTVILSSEEDTYYMYVK